MIQCWPPTARKQIKLFVCSIEILLLKTQYRERCCDPDINLTTFTLFVFSIKTSADGALASKLISVSDIH